VLQSVAVRCSISSDCSVDRESGDVVVDLCSDTISESDDVFDGNNVLDASFTAASLDCSGASIRDGVRADLSVDGVRADLSVDGVRADSSGLVCDDLYSDAVSGSDDVSDASFESTSLTTSPCTCAGLADIIADVPGVESVQQDSSRTSTSRSTIAFFPSGKNATAARGWCVAGSCETSGGVDPSVFGGTC